MNKTIIIHMNGVIFHIEEDAYTVLKNYLDEIKGYYNHSKDGTELMNDIEGRIAELFSELLRMNGSAVVDGKDVERVMAQMGKPTDFLAGDDGGSDTAAHAQAEIDIKKRFFRNGDDRIIGGVCSGMAAYLDIDQVWLRLVWAVLFLSFGFGFIPYLILWIIVPEAKTRADKLSMKGEKVTLKTIRNSVNKEFGAVKQTVEKLTNEASNPDFLGSLQDFLRRAFRLAGAVLSFLFKGVFYLVGGITLFTGLLLLATISVAFIALMVKFRSDVWEQFPLNVVPTQDQFIVTLAVFITAVIITIFLIYLGVKVFKRNLTLGIPITTICVILLMFSTGALMYYAITTAENFRKEASVTETIALKPVVMKRFTLRMLDDKIFSVNNGRHFRLDFDSVYENRMNIQIGKSDSLTPLLEEKFTARGRSTQEAIRNAEKIFYRFRQKDSLLYFPKTFSDEQPGRFHDQKMELNLKFPINTQLKIDSAMDDLITDLPDEDDYTFNGPKDEWLVTSAGLVPKYGQIKKDEEGDEE